MHETMAQKLKDHHRQIAAGIAEIRQHCDMPSPDTVGLGSSRLRLSRASTARARYVNEVVLPRLQQDSDMALHAELVQMQRDFNVKRLRSSEHVTTWSSKVIEADWDGYREAARRISTMMEERVDRERKILGERLNQLRL